MAKKKRKMRTKPELYTEIRELKAALAEASEDSLDAREQDYQREIRKLKEKVEMYRRRLNRQRPSGTAAIRRGR